MSNGVTNLDDINEFRVSFAHKDFGLITGFVCLQSLEVPVAGEFYSFVPSINKTITGRWENVSSAMMVGGLND